MTDRDAIREDGKQLLKAARARGPVALVTTRLALLFDLVFVGARHAWRRPCARWCGPRA